MMATDDDCVCAARLDSNPRLTIMLFMCMFYLCVMTRHVARASVGAPRCEEQLVQICRLVREEGFRRGWLRK